MGNWIRNLEMVSRQKFYMFLDLGDQLLRVADVAYNAGLPVFKRRPDFNLPHQLLR